MKIILTLGSILIALSSNAQISQPTITGAFSIKRQPVYQGENFKLVLTIISRGVNLGQQFSLTQIPETLSLLSEFHELPQSQREVNGTIEKIRQFQCQAKIKRAGILSLSPILHVQIVSRKRILFGSSLVKTSRAMPMNAFEIDCKPLPSDGKTSEFSGAIGQFALDIDITPHEVSIGELITVIITVKGYGTLEGVILPKLSDISGVKQYPQKKYITSTDPLSIRAEQIIIPEDEQVTTIPQIRFSFFDPNTGKYVTLTEGPFELIYKTAHQHIPYEPYRPKKSEESPSISEKPSELFSRKWVDYFRISTFLLALMVCSTCLAGVIFFAIGKRYWKRSYLFILTACFLGALTFGVNHWGAKYIPNKILARDSTARLAPSYSALESFGIQARTRVNLLEKWKEWGKVADGARHGWIPLNALSNESTKP